MIEKFRARIFAVSNLTVNGALAVTGATTLSGAVTQAGTITASGALVLPYTTSAPTLATNGMIAAGSVSGQFKLFLKSGGTLYTLAFPTQTSGGTITITSA